VNEAAMVLLLSGFVKITLPNVSVYYWHHKAITALNLDITIFSQYLPI